MSQDFNDWRELLECVLASSDKRHQLAKDIEVSSMTLSRWVSGESKPRIANLRLLLKSPLLRPYQQKLLELLEHDFPNENFRVFPIDHVMSDLPAELYAEILVNLRKLAPELRTWSICELLLDRMIRHFDPNNEGMILLIAQCVASSQEGLTDQKVTQLREMMVSSHRLTRRTTPGLFRGIEALAGYAVSEGMTIISQRDLDGVLLHDSQIYKSAAAFPLQRVGRLAGALIAQSPRENYVTPERKSLFEKYTDLLSVAFPDEDFFSRYAISLKEYIDSSHLSIDLDEAEKRVQKKIKSYAERVSRSYDTSE